MKSYVIAALAAVAFLSGPRVYGQVKVTRPEVSEEACPLVVIQPATRDGQKATAVVRKPPGKGPFPAVILLHAGMGRKELDRGVEGAKSDALKSQQHTRFLAAGYVTVTALRRGSKRDPQSPDSMADCLAIVEAVKKTNIPSMSNCAVCTRRCSIIRSIIARRLGANCEPLTIALHLC